MSPTQAESLIRAMAATGLLPAVSSHMLYHRGSLVVLTVFDKSQQALFEGPPGELFTASACWATSEEAGCVDDRWIWQVSARDGRLAEVA